MNHGLPRSSLQDPRATGDNRAAPGATAAQPAGNGRKARFRARQERGEIVLRVTVVEDALAEALLRAGRCDEVQAMSRSELERAIAALVADFVERWRRAGMIPPRSAYAY